MRETIEKIVIIAISVTVGRPEESILPDKKLDELDMDSLDRVEAEIEIEIAVEKQLGKRIAFEYDDFLPSITVQALIDETKRLLDDT